MYTSWTVWTRPYWYVAGPVTVRTKLSCHPARTVAGKIPDTDRVMDSKTDGDLTLWQPNLPLGKLLLC